VTPAVLETPPTLALEGYTELIDAYEGVCHSTAAAAYLAAGDAAAARHSYETARQRSGPRVMAATQTCSALAPLACGDLTAARRWAEMSCR
jgi:hypothetical protein